MFQCDLKEQNYYSWTGWFYHRDSLEDEKTSAEVMQETFEDLGLEYTGNESVDSAQLAEIIIDTWWEKCYLEIEWYWQLYYRDYYHYHTEFLGHSK